MAQRSDRNRRGASRAQSGKIRDSHRPNTAFADLVPIPHSTGCICSLCEGKRVRTRSIEKAPMYKSEIHALLIDFCFERNISREELISILGRIISEETAKIV